ncbi:DUF6972 family protein [Tychonema sp. BBK16]
MSGINRQITLDPDGSHLSLYYGEIKVDAENRYHATPRSRFSQE